MNSLKRLLRYGKVGICAAMVHAFVQLLLGILMPLWFSNMCGFLSASIVSYLGHSLYTYRVETKGRIFARRWLFLQFVVNITLSAYLPFALTPLGSYWLIRLILALTPIFINAVIWTKAVSFSQKRH